MTRFGWMVALFIGAGIILIAAFFIWRHARVGIPSHVSDQATTTAPANPSSLSIYTSGEYGFSLFYPSDALLMDAYSSTTLSGVSWRMGASGTGTPIVRIQEGREEVRVGMSSAAREVSACLNPGAAETKAGPFKVGSTTWQSFTFQKVGTDNEQLVTSYRTVHGSSCYALELFQPLAGAASSTGYTVGDTITSFSFAD